MRITNAVTFFFSLPRAFETGIPIMFPVLTILSPGLEKDNCNQCVYSVLYRQGKATLSYCKRRQIRTNSPAFMSIRVSCGSCSYFQTYIRCYMTCTVFLHHTAHQNKQGSSTFDSMHVEIGHGHVVQRKCLFMKLSKRVKSLPVKTEL